MDSRQALYPRRPPAEVTGAPRSRSCRTGPGGVSGDDSTPRRAPSLLPSPSAQRVTALSYVVTECDPIIARREVPGAEHHRPPSPEPTRHHNPKTPPYPTTTHQLPKHSTHPPDSPPPLSLIIPPCPFQPLPAPAGDCMCRRDPVSLRTALNSRSRSDPPQHVLNQSRLPPLSPPSLRWMVSEINHIGGLHVGAALGGHGLAVRVHRVRDLRQGPRPI